MSRLRRAASALAFFSCSLAAPGLAFARDEPPAAISYGFEGFWTGAQIGLASGYLATGREYESREWRKLVFGAGIGALAGVGAGITLGLVDVGAGAPYAGHIILRDMGYGVGLGAIVGTAVGALSWVDGGRPKNLLTGAAVGTLIGAGAGVIFGAIESAVAGGDTAPADRGQTGRWRFTWIGSEASLLPLAAVEGTF